MVDRDRELVAARFWRKVQRTDPCWLWTGEKNDHGYGRFWFGGRRESAHRVAWWLEHGAMPQEPLHVLHSCDRPSCVRASHLWLGTRSDNLRDASRKGRLYMQRFPDAFSGERHWTRRRGRC